VTDLAHSWTGTNGDPWDSTVFPTIRTVTGSSPTPTIQSNQGRMITGGTGGGFGDRHDLYAFTADTYDDTQVLVKVAAVTSGAYLQIGFRIGANVTSGEPGDGYMLEWETGVSHFNVWDRGTDLIVAYQRDIVIDPGVANWLRVHARGSQLRARFWADGDTEPTFWHIDAVDTHWTTGRVYLGVFNQALGDPVTVDWDDLEVNEILPPPPGIRMGLSADLLDALYIGDHGVVEAVFIGDEEVPVP
jgi:hypothetical protein